VTDQSEPGSTYDPTIYRGSAAHYLAGRPPYSALLADVVRAELQLDGTGRLLDVGCGPGVLAVHLAGLFEEVIGIDPDPDMIAEARRHAADRGVTHSDWIVARAEDIPVLALPPVRVVTFGQSFHWTDRERVAEAVFDLLPPGGAIVLVVHDIDVGSPPADVSDPPIPDDDVQALVRRYLGPEPRAGQGFGRKSPDRYEDALARTRFGTPKVIHAPGRPNLTRDVSGVISGYLSMSYAAPHLFGDDLDAFVADLRTLLEEQTPTGRFSDWPGDTAVLLAIKAG
jgi:ubiquinone/menaquinone biosynthesis C-methylase UbiE